MPAPATLEEAPMTTFDKRKNEAEARFKHDEELKFKANSRRNKLFGLWAAEQMGLTGASAEVYAKEVVISDFERPGDDDVLEKVLKDLADKGVEASAHRLRKEMDRLMEIAREQVLSD
jgi:hypothetical protein